MRILIGTYDVAGWLNQFRLDLEAMGHEVTTAVQTRNPFLDFDYDVNLQERFDRYRLFRTGVSSNLFMRVFNKLQNTIAYHFFGRNLSRLIDDHDMVIRLWSPFLPNSRENRIIKEKGKKLIVLFVGSDVRNHSTFRQEFDTSRWTFPEAFIVSSMEQQLKLIRHAEKYADAVFSVPDQAGLQLRPYHHLQVPAPIDRCTYALHPERKMLKVLHAPSAPYKKGTDIIESTIQRLLDEGMEFEFVSIRDMPQERVLEMLTDADVLVDEIVFHGPGALSFEAMLSGCAVATRYMEDSPDFYRPPVWQIDAENIYDRLKHLLGDPVLVRRLAEEGRMYVLEKNDSKRIVADFLRKAENPDEYDYIPRFLTDRYRPTDRSEAALINKWTRFVKDTDWYAKHVTPQVREGLEF